MVASLARPGVIRSWRIEPVRKSHSRWIFIAASPAQDAATAGELVGQLVGQCDGTAVADANARELVQQVDGLRRRGQHPEHGALQHRTKEPHELRREAILDGRRSDVEAQLCSGGLEIGGLGIRFSEQSQDEHPQQADGGELSTPLDNTCRPPKFLGFGSQDILYSRGDLAYNLHREAPSSSTRRIVTRDGIRAFRFSCKTNFL